MCKLFSFFFFFCYFVCSQLVCIFTEFSSFHAFLSTTKCFVGSFFGNFLRHWNENNRLLPSIASIRLVILGLLINCWMDRWRDVVVVGSNPFKNWFMILLNFHRKWIETYWEKYFVSVAIETCLWPKNNTSCNCGVLSVCSLMKSFKFQITFNVQMLLTNSQKRISGAKCFHN